MMRLFTKKIMQSNHSASWKVVVLRGLLEASAYTWPSASGWLSMQLFSSPRKGRLQPGQYDWLDSARHSRLSLGDNDLQIYHWPGKGKRVLLLHGWESNSSRWFGLWQELRKAGCDVWAMDAPAHGYSGGKRFTAVQYGRFLAKALDVYAPASIVAHSAGSMATLFCLAKLQPSAPVERVVLLGTPANLDGLLDRYQQILGVSPLVMRRMDEWLKKRYGFDPAIFSMPLLAAQLSQPALLIHDEEDTTATPADGKALHAAWRNSQLLLTRGLGHSIQSPEVWHTITDFVARTDSN